MPAQVASPIASSGTDGNAAGIETKDRLCQAAERLVARHGVDGPSNRAICAEAGANSAAVHYHFGSREDLLQAVLHRNLDTVRSRRLALIDKLDADQSPTAIGVARALVAPMAEVDEHGDGSYGRFLFQLTVAGPEWRAQVGEAFAPQFDRLLRVLQRAIPDVPVATAEQRLVFSVELLLAALATPKADVDRFRPGLAGDSGPSLQTSLTEYIAGALAAPPH